MPTLAFAGILLVNSSRCKFENSGLRCAQSLRGCAIMTTRTKVRAQYSRDKRRRNPLNDRRLVDIDNDNRYSYERERREFDYEVDNDNRKFASREGGTNDSGPLSKLPTWTILSAFLIGIGFGSAFDTVINFDARDLSSREVIDRAVPNPSICITNGYTAMVMDTRMFVSFNPFNVYISQPEVKPGCVMRRENWRELEKRQLLTNTQVNQCKMRSNTFAYVGDINKSPEISCVYHSEDAENRFLKDPARAALGDGIMKPPSREEMQR